MLKTVVVLRHALAGDRNTWAGEDAARPLDARGVEQSLALVEALAEWPLDQILTSPAVRCRHTVTALAAERRLPVHDAPWLAACAEPEAIAAGLAALSSASGSSASGSSAVLLCTHRESLGPLMAALTEGSPLAPADPSLDKGAAWGLRFDAGALVEVELLAAPGRMVELGQVRPLAAAGPA